MILVTLGVLIYLGLAQRVLDRMRLTDTTALLLLGALFIAPYIPDVGLVSGIRIDLAGMLIPIGIVVYLIATADQSYERSRAVLAIIVTGAVIFAFDQLLPPEPTQEFLLDIDPLLLIGLVAAFVGYLSGRSRRSAFIAAVGGVAWTDLITGIMASVRGVQGAFAAIGGGGAFDAMIIGGVLAVLLAELFGETREWWTRRAGEGGRSSGERLTRGAQEDPGRPFWTFVGLGMSALLIAGSPSLGDRLYTDMHPHGPEQLVAVYDEQGEFLRHSAYSLHVGDQWIDEANRIFEIIQTQPATSTAVARPLGTLTLPTPPAPPQKVSGAIPAQAEPSAQPSERRRGLIPWLESIWNRNTSGQPSSKQHTILIIHTHNAESYAPDGGEALVEGAGDIHEVGKQLAKELEQRGFHVIHDETLHLPHDRGAYRRSRRTILSHFPKRPVIVVDVHRDAIPDRSEYIYEQNGEEVARTRIVVGRSNPNRSQTLEFAKQLKSVADEQDPELMKEIFIARNNYNQDLGPRVILFEVGTHLNSLDEALRTTSRLADLLESYVERYMNDE